MTIQFEKLKARLLANPKVKAEYDALAPEFARDRAWRPIELTSYGSHPMTLRTQDGDLLTFGEREVALRRKF